MEFTAAQMWLIVVTPYLSWTLTLVSVAVIVLSVVGTFERANSGESDEVIREGMRVWVICILVWLGVLFVSMLIPKGTWEMERIIGAMNAKSAEVSADKVEL